MHESLELSTASPTGLLIDGRWLDGAGRSTAPIVDPATGLEVDRVTVADDADVDDALAAAQAGFERWRAVSPWERSAVLRRAGQLIHDRRDAIAEVLTQEQGKPISEARDEVAAAAEQFDWYADETRRIYGRVIEGRSEDIRMQVIRQPIGPVAAFSAWNFPALLPARKMAAALAAGCSIIVKPADEAPRTALCLAEALQDAGLPDGALGVLMGDAPRIGDRLVRSPIIRKVSLTGSVPVGRTIMRTAAENLTQLTLELGGHAPVLVFRDADLDTAVPAMVHAKFRNAGQVCAAPSRFFVAREIADEVLERFVAEVGRLRVGPGSDEETQVGPLSNRRRLTAMSDLVAEAVQDGAELLAGGGRPSDADPEGFFFEPTVISAVEDSMRVMSEEPFGPLAPFSAFDDIDEAIVRANATDLGLAAYVFTRDLATANRASERIESGMVGVNNFGIALAEAPFGGIKQSGFGREGGTEGVESYTVCKYVNMRLV